ncbi:hypothetical protein [Merismopedia glauca]|uniref:Uncharacterized protein n=1 Tax=Merismopedia glauca CCAP 1448/3 TaxID=1296344 RepID=A0A2T1C7P8_9CYAN|nr:hypothetical protein [Merismopedia glauca]PSB04281.1 hypothetical protein C7B64_04795 [Merismopedia glauca CCAP 1448/3]
MFDLPESDLIEIYNYLPQILLRKAIKILVKESDNSGDRLILTEERNGNYWAIATEEKTNFLFPKAYYKINEFNINTVNQLFDCQNFESKETREFIVKKPAIVSRLPDAEQWKLEAKGILEFGNKSSSELEQLKNRCDRLQSQVEDLMQERDRLALELAELACDRLSEIRSQLVTKDEFKKEIELIKQERSQFSSQISQLQQNVSQTFSNYEAWCQNTNQSINSLTTKVGEIQTKVAQLQEYSRNNQRLNSVTQINAPTPTSSSVKPTEFRQVNLSQALSWEEANLVSKYNNNPNIFTNKIEVSETKESNDNRHGGSNQSPILEISRRGNYWIISESDFYYLVPNPNLKLNEFNYKTVEAFFKYHNYPKDFSQKLRLFKPAQVSPLPGGEKWELIQPGVIQATTKTEYNEDEFLFYIPPYYHLLNVYNRNPHTLLGKAIEVRETEDSINIRRLSGDSSATLERQNGGSYWIIKEENTDYVLLKKNFKINDYNHFTVEVLFECRNYYSNYSDYKLVKPATVQMISGGTWQLQERGVLEFH